MKIRILIILIIVVVIVTTVISFSMSINNEFPNKTVSCGKDFIQIGDECHPDSSLLESNTVLIYPITDNSGTRTITVPYDMIIYLEKDNKVTWINKGFYTATVYDIEGGTWSTGEISPSMQKSIQFNSTGFYDYQIDTTYEGNSGNIVAISNETNSLPLEIRMKMGMSIVSNYLGSNPALIGVGIGSIEKGVIITINQEELKKLDGAESFYYNMYDDLIPFDIPITIEFSTPIVPTG